MHAFADLDVSVLSTAFTADARFVLSGSDDGNVRVWKANASEKLGVITARERAAIEYRETLKDKWKADQQVGKVQRYVSFTFGLFIADLDISGAAIYRSRCTRPLVEGVWVCSQSWGQPEPRASVPCSAGTSQLKCGRERSIYRISDSI